MLSQDISEDPCHSQEGSKGPHPSTGHEVEHRAPTEAVRLDVMPQF